MRSKPDDQADQAAAEALILDADAARPGWERRAVGVSAAAALAQIPADDFMATIQTRMQLDAFRILQHHIADAEVNQALWLRQAAVEKYLREGGDPQAAARMLAVKQARRRHDVPRDVRGQQRGRSVPHHRQPRSRP